MKHELKMAITGIRGVVGETLTKEVVFRFGKVYGEMLGKGSKVVVGRDTRTSGPDLENAVIVALQSEGCLVITIGIVPTPTGERSVPEYSADGGVIVTASHNPPEYNGLKFVGKDGMFELEERMNEIIERFQRSSMPEKINSTLEEVEEKTDAIARHVNTICEFVDTSLIKSRNFKIVVDPVNGTGAVADPVLFEKLGVPVTIIHGTPSGEFERPTEPTPQALVKLGEKVNEIEADIGFAQDPDADRLSIVDENGKAIGQEYTLAFVTWYMLKKYNKPGATVVVNISSSRMIDDIAKMFDAKVIRTKVGEMYVAESLRENNGLVGGEGPSSGIIVPEIGWGRDSLLGMALMLEFMAITGKKVSELVKEIPQYEILQKKKELNSRDELESVLEKVRKEFVGEQIDEMDGVKVILEKSWLHVRASNTEPIMRYIAEAPTKEEAEDLIERVWSH